MLILFFGLLQNQKMAKATGTVKWFNVKKGYGFITPGDGGDDIFVHQTAIHAEGFRSLKEEEEVEFEISDNGGKSKAVNVTGPSGAFVQGAPRRARVPRAEAGEGGEGGEGAPAGGSGGGSRGGRGGRGGGRGGRGGKAAGDKPADESTDAPQA